MRECAASFAQEVVGRRAAVERAQDGVRGEPHRRRGAPRLDVRRDLHEALERARRPARHDAREVALEQQVVDLGREDGLEGGAEVGRTGVGRRRDVVGPHQGPARGSERAGPRHPEQRGLPQQPRDRLLRRHRARRAPPQHRDDVGGGERAPGGEVEHVEDRPAEPRHPRAPQLRVERGTQGALLVAAPHEPGGAARAPPAAGEGRPAVAQVVVEPVLRGEGRGERGRVVAVVGHEPGCCGQLDDRGRRRVVHLQGERGAAQVAHPEPAGTQHARRVLGPVRHEARDEAHGLQPGARGLRVDRGSRELPYLRDGRRGPHVAVGAAAAQGEPDLARQHDVALVGRAQVAVPHEPVRRTPGRRVRPGSDADRRAPGQRVEDRPGARRRVVGQVGRRPRGRCARCGRDRAQAGGVRPQDLGEARRRAVPGRPRARRPHERELVEQRQRRGDGRPADARRAGDRRRRRGRAHRVEDQHRLQDVQRELVQPRERPFQARPVHRARGEREEGRGRRRREVGPPSEQRDQGGVVALAQRLAVCRSPLGPGGGHPFDVTRRARYHEIGDRGRDRQSRPPISTEGADVAPDRRSHGGGRYGSGRRPRTTSGGTCRRARATTWDGRSREVTRSTRCPVRSIASCRKLLPDENAPGFLAGSQPGRTGAVLHEPVELEQEPPARPAQVDPHRAGLGPERHLGLRARQPGPQEDVPEPGLPSRLRARVRELEHVPGPAGTATSWSTVEDGRDVGPADAAREGRVRHDETVERRHRAQAVGDGARERRRGDAEDRRPVLDADVADVSCHVERGGARPAVRLDHVGRRGELPTAAGRAGARRTRGSRRGRRRGPGRRHALGRPRGCAPPRRVGRRAGACRGRCRAAPVPTRRRRDGVGPPRGGARARGAAASQALDSA